MFINQFYYFLEFHAMSQEINSQTSSVTSHLSIENVLPVVNDAFKLLNQSPIVKKHADNPSYLYNKVNKACQEMKTSFGLLNDTSGDKDSKDMLDIIEKLKTKFNDGNTTRSEKI